jgi:hypothetical protein
LKAAPGEFLARLVLAHAHEDAKRFTPARQARTHRPDRNPDDPGYRLVREAFEAYEQNHNALLLRKQSHGPIQVPKLQVFVLARGARQRQFGLANRDGCAFANSATNVIDVLVVKDGEKPRPQVGAFLPQVYFGKPADQAILHQVVSRNDVTSQRASVSTQPRDFIFDPLVHLSFHGDHILQLKVATYKRRASGQ